MTPNVLEMTVLAVVLCPLFCAASSGSQHPHLRVAMAQIRVEDGDLAGNVRRAGEAARAAAKQGANLVCLPEAADYGWLYQDARKDAFPIPGRYTDFLCSLAKELKVWVCGGCLERDGDRVYNSAVIIDRRGRIVLKHRKISTLPEITAHIYDAGPKDGVSTAETEFGRLGLTICADNFNLKIPQRAADQGAWLLITPHGFAESPGRFAQNAKGYQEHIRNIAKHTKMWVVGTDAVMGKVTGGAWKGKYHVGCSTIANPAGEAVAVGKFLHPDLIIYDIVRASETADERR